MNEYTNEELIRMARWQRRLLWTLVYSWIAACFFCGIVLYCSNNCSNISVWVAVLLLVAKWSMVFAFTAAFYVIYYKLLLTYHSPVFKIFAGILGVFMIVPIANLIVLLIVSNPATSLLKQAGLRVGLLGVSEYELRKLQN